MANDTWATPQVVFDKLNERFNFVHDVCAQHTTAKCPSYWTEEDDAFKQDWVNGVDPGKGWLWCNPPYSGIGPWVKRATEAQVQGRGTVMLVMCDPSVKWFARAIEAASEVIFVTQGRLAFLNDGVVRSGNNKGSLILIFDPDFIGECQTRYIPRSYFTGEE